jgi:hypothetical protein
MVDVDKGASVAVGGDSMAVKGSLVSRLTLQEDA